MSTPDNWFEDFFHGVTLDLWRQAIPPKQTTAEAEFILDHLKCESGARVLDVPCGNGRLSFEMAQRRLRVTGIDISREFIEEARSTQDRRPAAAGIEFVLGDMREIQATAIYDGGYCFGNSFAFFDYENTRTFLRSVQRALKPNARFLIQTGMAAESVLPDFEEQSSHEFGDLQITIKERYIAAESCIDSEYVFERNGQTESRLAREWIYTTAEIQRMLESAGFNRLNLYGSLKGEPYKLGDQELFIVAENLEFE